MKKLYRRNRIVFVCLILMMVFTLAPLYAAEEYSSNTKSPTGTMESRDMYFPGTEELDLDEMRMTLNRLVQAIENTPEKRWEYKTVSINYITTRDESRYATGTKRIRVDRKSALYTGRQISSKDLSILNEHGKDGWELCGVGSNLYFLKREIRE